MHNFKSYTIYKAVFSPTYGTAHAASILAEQLSLNIASEKIQKLDLTFPSAREIQHYFSDSDLVIAGAPVYGGQLPPVKELFENLHGNQTPCVLLICYGNRHYDDALAQLKSVMIRQGFLPVGAIACIIPHVFSEKVGAGRPNVSDLRLIAGFANTLKEKFEYDRFELTDVPGNPDPQPKPKTDVPKFRDESLCSLRRHSHSSRIILQSNFKTGQQIVHIHRFAGGTFHHLTELGAIGNTYGITCTVYTRFQRCVSV